MSSLTELLIVVMGVSGSGKSTIGELLARRMGLTFADADAFHSEANKRKMAAGEPLTDEDRLPWLERLNDVLKEWRDDDHGGVLACSALRAEYRETLGKDLPPALVKFVVLDVPEQLLRERLAHRQHSFMNPSLLPSQMATFERPQPGTAIEVCNDRDPEQVVAEIRDELGTPGRG